MWENLNWILAAIATHIQSVTALKKPIHGQELCAFDHLSIQRIFFIQRSQYESRTFRYVSLFSGIDMVEVDE